MLVRSLLTYLFLFVFFGLNLQADEISKEVKEIFYKAINSKEIDNEKRFYLLVLAARNVKKRLPRAPEIEELYLKSFKIESIKPTYKLRAYFELLQHYYLIGKKSDIKNIVLAIEKEIKQLDDNSKERSLLILDYYRVVLSDKTVEEVLGKPITKFFGTEYDFSILYRELEILIKRKKFIKAYDLLSMKRVTSNDYKDIILTYDLLSFFKGSKTTHCTDFAKVYPKDDLSKICLNLKEFKASKESKLINKMLEITDKKYPQIEAILLELKTKSL